MDLKGEMRAAYQNAYNENSGLEHFHHSKRLLIWGMFGIAVIRKLIVAISMFSRSPLAALIGIALGICIAGIFAVAIYQGPWKFSYGLYFLAAYMLFDFIRYGIPALTSGISYQPIFYVTMVLQLFFMIYLLLLALWLSVPVKNRNYADILNKIFREYSNKMKEMAKQ